MTNTLTARRAVGDKVSINDPKFPGVWTIKSVGPKNFVVIPDAGGRGLRAPHHLVIDPVTTTPGVTVEAVPYVPVVRYHAGEIVRVEQGRFAGLYVVIADKGDKVNIALLGGDGGRYVRALRASLTKVDLADVVK